MPPQIETNMWVLATGHGYFMDCPMDMDECASNMHIFGFTLYPDERPFNLSTFVPKTPQVSPHDIPEKLLMCMAYCPYSDSSPRMIKTVSKREFDLTGKWEADSREIARVLGSSNLYLIQMPTCRESYTRSLWQSRTFTGAWETG